MGIKSTISPPEGHIRRAELWNYSVNTTLESISCLRGYCYHFRDTAPLPVGETERCMYIRVISLHFKALVRQERERECVCVCVGKRERGVGGVAAIVLDLVLLGVALPVAVAGQVMLPGANLGVVLSEFGEGFKGLWVPYQHRCKR